MTEKEFLWRASHFQIWLQSPAATTVCGRGKSTPSLRTRHFTYSHSMRSASTRISDGRSWIESERWDELSSTSSPHSRRFLSLMRRYERHARQMKRLECQDVIERLSSSASLIIICEVYLLHKLPFTPYHSLHCTTYSYGRIF